MHQTRTLVADSSSLIRQWFATSLGPSAGRVTGVAYGWQVLSRLAEEPYDLVITGGRLPDLTGEKLLAMVRTAGLEVPFLLILPLFSERARELARKATRARVLDDWSDGAAIRRAASELMSSQGQTTPSLARARG